MRHNQPSGKRSRMPDFRHYDDDFAFRPDRPDIKYFVDHRRKTIFLNMEADPDAADVMHVRLDDDEDLPGGVITPDM